jgi:hypothetical protein
VIDSAFGDWHDRAMAKSRGTPRSRGQARNGTRQRASSGPHAVPDGPDLGVDDLRRMLAEAGAPDEVMRSLDGLTEPDEVLQRLGEAGVLPSPDESLDAVLEGWRPLLARGCSGLDAELCGLEFLAILRDAVESTELPLVLDGMVAQAELRGGPEALAMLRVLAVVGPATIRAAANSAADRLVAGGLVDRPWVEGLGTPKAGRSFGYADEVGSQETLVLTFGYGRKRHAIAVLIDHDLGGGVKDCWVTDQVAGLRERYAEAGAQIGVDVVDYSAAEARAIVEGALAQPPCPVDRDQIEDVDKYLDLLRRRIGWEPAGGAGAATYGMERAAQHEEGMSARQGAAKAEGPTGERVSAITGGPTVHRLTITLQGTEPAIWRQVEVSSTITLHRLHSAIQAAFGWENSHLWVFSTPQGDYGVPDGDTGHRSASSKKLEAVAPSPGDWICYTYDFGDTWDHAVVVDAVVNAEPGVAYPRYLTGQRAGPPEDCGGVWGYEDLLRILADPADEEHDERLEWLGLSSADGFDSEAFDVDWVTAAVAAQAKVLVH